MSSEWKPPPRLVEDPSTSSLVRADLENVAGLAPGYDAAGGLASLQAALGGGAKVAAGATATHAVKGALGLKLAIAGGASAIVIAGAVMLMQPAPATKPPATKPVVSQPLQAPPAPAPAPAPVAPVLAPEPERAPPAPASSGTSRDAAAAEIAQLAQIKAIATRSPARALKLAEQGHRRFGEGYLHHEREGLAIVALHALGRDSEARARGTKFLARYPHSSLSERVRALQAQAGER